MVDWVQLIRDALVEFHDVHLLAGIPDRKLANARVACRVPVGEAAIGLLDRTVWGSAKNAVVYGERAIYIRDRWTEDEPHGVLVVEYLRLAALDLAPVPTAVRRTLEALHRAVDAIKPPAVDDAPIVYDAGDVGQTPEGLALQEAIASAPQDDGPQLVLADLLLAAEDPRGELIVLHQRETTEGLRDPAALERYLFLGALYSFPRAQPEPPVLDFVGSRTRYSVTHDDHRYTIVYATGGIEVLVDDRSLFRRRLRLTERSSLTPREATAILRHFSDAIRAGTPLQNVQLPFGPDPLPTYGGGPVRCYRVPVEFTRPRGLQPNELGLAARDYHHWIACWRRLSRALHPSSS